MSRSLFLLAAVPALLLTGCGSPSQHAVDEKYFLVSANIKVPYWQEAFAGLSRAATEMHVKAEQVGPDTYDPKAQHEQFQEVLKQKPSGILVSDSDPNLLREDIDAAIASGVPVITIDSDASASKRLMFIGTDNYKVGTMAGKVAAERLHGKGTVVVYTMPDQPNLKERMRGYADVFAAYPQIKVVETVDIKGDRRIAYDRTEEMAAKGAKVDAFVCLEAIACPEIVEALSRRNITGKVIVAMDTDPRTLEGIQKGTIAATIGQKPFTMAYVGLKMLDDLHHHPPGPLTNNWAQDPVSPLPSFVDTGATLIDKSNVGAFIQARSAAAPPH